MDIVGKHEVTPVVASAAQDLKQGEVKEVEHVNNSVQVCIVDEDEVEVQFHARTWFALAAFFLLNFVQVIALQGPSVVVRTNLPKLH